MTGRGGRLVAVDGVNGSAVMACAREQARTGSGDRHDPGAISAWDASGIFGELAVADPEAGRPSPRTLILLYAADLAFRLRWEIRPALQAGRPLVVAPYVETGIAFGHALGFDVAWLDELFSFAPEPSARLYVHAPPAHMVAARKGFVEFACQRMAGPHSGAVRQELVSRAARKLQAMDRRHRAERR